jgi:hypothetical protein
MTPSPASLWRRDVARRLAVHYAANPNVAAILCGGSAARGLADQYSDLEFCIFWHTPPTEAARRAAPTAAGADGLHLYPYDAALELWEDTFFIGRATPDAPQTGLLVEAESYTVAGMEHILHLVLDEWDTDDVRHSVLSTLGEGHHLPLHGADLLAGWTARAAVYPDGLAEKLVRRHGQIEFLWVVEMLVARANNLPRAYEVLNSKTDALLRTLLALNRQYYFGFKWLDYVVAQLPLAPPDLGARLRAVYAGDPLAGMRVLTGLIEEMYDLLEPAFPALDVAQLRTWFRWQRPRWEDSPPWLPDALNANSGLS